MTDFNQAFPITNYAGTIIGTLHLDEQIVKKVEESADANEHLFDISWAFDTGPTPEGHSKLINVILFTKPAETSAGIIASEAQCEHLLHLSGKTIRCKFTKADHISHEATDGFDSWRW